MAKLTKATVVIVGERIKELREQRNMTCRDLAIAAGLSLQTIANWENGIRIPQERKLERVAEALDVELADLVGSKTRITASKVLKYYQTEEKAKREAPAKVRTARKPKIAPAPPVQPPKTEEVAATFDSRDLLKLILSKDQEQVKAFFEGIDALKKLSDMGML